MSGLSSGWALLTLCYLHIFFCYSEHHFLEGLISPLRVSDQNLANLNDPAFLIHRLIQLAEFKFTHYDFYTEYQYNYVFIVNGYILTFVFLCFFSLFSFYWVWQFASSSCCKHLCSGTYIFMWTSVDDSESRCRFLKLFLMSNENKQLINLQILHSDCPLYKF